VLGEEKRDRGPRESGSVVLLARDRHSSCAKDVIQCLVHEDAIGGRTSGPFLAWWRWDDYVKGIRSGWLSLGYLFLLIQRAIEIIIGHFRLDIRTGRIGDKFRMDILCGVSSISIRLAIWCWSGQGWLERTSGLGGLGRTNGAENAGFRLDGGIGPFTDINGGRVGAYEFKDNIAA